MINKQELRKLYEEAQKSSSKNVKMNNYNIIIKKYNNDQGWNISALKMCGSCIKEFEKSNHVSIKGLKSWLYD